MPRAYRCNMCDHATVINNKIWFRWITTRKKIVPVCSFCYLEIQEKGSKSIMSHLKEKAKEAVLQSQVKFKPMFKCDPTQKRIPLYEK